MLLAALIGLLQLLFNVAGQIPEPLFGEISDDRRRTCSSRRSNSALSPSAVIPGFGLERGDLAGILPQFNVVAVDKLRCLLLGSFVIRANKGGR
jgi:hypothetical protein